MQTKKKTVEYKSVKKLQDLLINRCGNPSDPIIRLTASISHTQNQKTKSHTFTLDTCPYKDDPSNLS